MAAIIGVIFLAGMASLPRQLGKAKASRTMGEFFAKSRGVNLLAAARIFLFGAREVWFMVGLPVFLYAAGWTFIEVGAFLAAWTIGYGLIQAVRTVAGGPQRRRAQQRSASRASVGRAAVRGVARPGIAAARAGACGGPTWFSSRASRSSACRSPSIPRCTPI
jgi:hypothetical protein